MKDGTCTIPCYVEEEDCNLTVVKIFLAKHFESKEDLPMLYKLNRVMWHGEYIFNEKQSNKLIYSSR